MTKSLTEQRKQGELPEGWYYVKDEDGHIIISEYFSYCSDKAIDEIEYDWTCGSEPEQILVEVPSYEKWQAKEKENTKLKELLKDCLEVLKLVAGETIDFPRTVDECINQISQVLGEE